MDPVGYNLARLKKDKFPGKLFGVFQEIGPTGPTKERTLKKPEYPKARSQLAYLDVPGS